MSLHEQHQAALAELETAKLRCAEVELIGPNGLASPESLMEYAEAADGVKRAAAKCNAIAIMIARLG